ncbi:JAB domain-containing protein [Kordia sp.]|uniref:JAB domain-containing protein n=1 Tax=Kordia sp. TaxID=1965332 RepID=UPI003D6B7DE5
MSIEKPVSNNAKQRVMPNETDEVIQTVRDKVLSQIPVAKIELQYNIEIPKSDRLKITSSRMATDILRRLFQPNSLELQEQFLILFLNNSNEIMGYFPISVGGMTGTVVDVRLVFSAALNCGAVACIASHNHPSGTLKPSAADKAITKKLGRAGEFLDIKLLDHIIVTKESYFSFADESLL